MATVILTKTEHQKFANVWRAAIPHGEGTRNARRSTVENAAKQIYKDYPEIPKALELE